MGGDLGASETKRFADTGGCCCCCCPECFSPVIQVLNLVAGLYPRDCGCLKADKPKHVNSVLLTPEIDTPPSVPLPSSPPVAAGSHTQTQKTYLRSSPFRRAERGPAYASLWKGIVALPKYKKVADVRDMDNSPRNIVPRNPPFDRLHPFRICQHSPR